MPPKIGEILVGAKAITADIRDRALGQRAKMKGRFGSALLEVSSISEMLVLRALSVQRQVPPANASDLVEIRPDILRLVPAKLAAKLFVIPFRRVGRTVSLAMLDPADLPAVDEITFLTGLPIAPHIGLEVRINSALHRLYGIEVSTRFLDLARRIEPTAPRPAVEPPPRPPAPVQASIPTPRPMAPPVAATPARHLPPLPPPGAPPPPTTIRRDGESGFTLPDSGDPWGDGLDGGLATDSPLFTEVFEGRQPRSGQATPPPGSLDVPRPMPAGLHPPPAARPARPAPTPAPAAPPPRAAAQEIDDEDLRRLRSRPAPALPSPPPPPEPAPEAVEPALEAMPEAVIQQPSEAALAEPSVDVDELPPPSAAGLVDRLSAADGRDDVADAVLEATKEHLQKAALFIVQSERVIGWAALPEPAEGFRKFSLPFKTASVFATLRNTDGFYTGPCPELPGNREILKALSSSGLPNVAVVPVTIRGKTVLFLFGEAAGSTPVNVTPLRRLATMTATALEIILLRNRLRNM